MIPVSKFEQGSNVSFDLIHKVDRRTIVNERILGTVVEIEYSGDNIAKLVIDQIVGFHFFLQKEQSRFQIIRRDLDGEEIKLMANKNSKAF